MFKPRQPFAALCPPKPLLAGAPRLPKTRPPKDRLMAGKPDDTTPETKGYTADEILRAAVDTLGISGGGLIIVSLLNHGQVRAT
jgi:hypothetical protein